MRYVVELVSADQLKPGDSFLSGSFVFVVDYLNFNFIFYHSGLVSEGMCRTSFDYDYGRFLEFWRVVK